MGVIEAPPNYEVGLALFSLPKINTAVIAQMREIAVNLAVFDDVLALRRLAFDEVGGFAAVFLGATLHLIFSVIS